MKIGGGLHYVDGPQGHGKSLLLAREIGEAIITGRHVVTNVPLKERWELRIARHDPWAYLGGRRGRIAAYRSRYHYVTSIEEAMRFRLLCRCGSQPAVCGHQQPEGRSLFAWDETHNELGNRTWKDDGRELVITWATQLRKLGYVGLFATQHMDNTDAALRRVCGWRIRMQNQREAVRVLGLKVLPMPLFLACFFPANVPMTPGIKPEFIERFFLSWHRNLYRTNVVYHGLDEDIGAENLVWLA